MQTSTFLPSVSPCISSLSSISSCDGMMRFHFAMFSSATRIPPFIYHSGRLSRPCRNFPTVSSQPQFPSKVAARASNIRANPAPTKVLQFGKQITYFLRTKTAFGFWFHPSVLPTHRKLPVLCASASLHHWDINGYNRVWYMTGAQ